MSIFNLFSKRQKLLRGEVPDVYSFDEIPDQFRVQIVHIVRDAIGEDHYSGDYARNAYQKINKILCREYGVFELTKYAQSDAESVFQYFLSLDETDRVLDIIEVSFKMINTYVRDSSYQYNTDTKMKPDDAIDELNGRFKEHGIGYRFESHEIIRVDSEFLHSEVVKPTLLILRDRHYSGANEEFLKAHEHYRHSRYKECLNEFLKAFESTMKSICKKRKWQYKDTDTAKALLSTCMSNGLVPDYLQSYFSGLRSVLESGTPTIRNKLGGHGQGQDRVTVPEEFARYTLNMTAANILFLAECEEKLK